MNKSKWFLIYGLTWTNLVSADDFCSPCKPDVPAGKSFLSDGHRLSAELWLNCNLR